MKIKQAVESERRVLLDEVLHIHERHEAVERNEFREQIQIELRRLTEIRVVMTEF